MIFYKGKRILEMVDSHYEAVLNSFRYFTEFMAGYLEHGAGNASELCAKIDSEEKRADTIRRSIVNEFLSGGMLAQTRAELLRIVELVDGVANKCQDLSRQILYEDVEFPGDIKGDIWEVIRLTQDQLDSLSTAIEALFSNDEKLLKDSALLEQVKHYEELVDEKELCLIKAIFHKDISLAEKSHYKYFVSKIADISDLIEDIADAVQIMVVFRKV